MPRPNRCAWVLSTLLLAIAGCSASPKEPSAETAAQHAATASTRAVDQQRATIHTWFDPETAHDLMTWRKKFDEAEAQAVAEFDEALGEYRRTAMPVEDYRNQVARRARNPRARGAVWPSEQRRKAAPAWLVRNKKVDAAEAELTRKTLATLKAFFRSELKARRISEADYERFTRDLQENTFPSIRRRKWAGPAAYDFSGVHSFTAGYRSVLQEMRKLWHAQAIRAQVLWTEPDPAFYSKLGGD